MNNPFLQQNIVDCCRLLAVGCVDAAAAKSARKTKPRFGLRPKYPG